MSSLLLVHSPLLGPSIWGPVRSAASESGLPAVIADLRPALGRPGPMWPEMVRLARIAARPLPRPVDAVAHSGAGAVLPGVGAALGDDLGRLVFVDAVLPPEKGAHRYSSGIRSRVAELAGDDGSLPPWPDWWPPEALSAMLPDPGQVDLLRSDAPAAPLAWFEEEIPVPIAWSEGDNSYIRLSGAYDDELNRARQMGWQVWNMESHHLGMITNPRQVLDAILA